MGINANSDNGLPIYIPSEMHRNRSVTDFDRTHVLQSAAVVELPFGKGKRYLSNGSVASALAGGWQLNTGFAAFTGNPFTVNASASSLNAPGGANFTGANTAQLADQVKTQVEKLGGAGVGLPFFDRAAYAPVRDARLGTSARNGLRGPGAVNVDLSLFRTFTLTERFRLEFRAESYNLTNTPHFANPSGDTASTNFGFITNTAEQDQRNFRFALRLSF